MEHKFSTGWAVGVVKSVEKKMKSVAECCGNGVRTLSLKWIIVFVASVQRLFQCTLQATCEINQDDTSMSL